MLWKILAIGASKSSSCCSLLGFTTRFFSSRLSLILESLLATDVVKEVDLALGSILSVGLENRYCLEGGFFKLSDLIISELLHSHIFSGFTTIGECYTSVTVSRNSSSSFLSWVNVCQRFFIILSFPDSCTHRLIYFLHTIMIPEQGVVINEGFFFFESYFIESAELFLGGHLSSDHLWMFLYHQMPSRASLSAI